MNVIKGIHQFPIGTKSINNDDEVGKQIYPQDVLKPISVLKKSYLTFKANSRVNLDIEFQIDNAKEVWILPKEAQ